jgi:hypothetical protein
MFRGQGRLETFEADMPNLTHGNNSMFMYCYSLESFKGDLSRLINGYGMFGDCTSLRTFESDLSSLTNGYDMFSNWGGYCKLDTSSVQNIATTIKDVNSLTNGASSYSSDIYKQINFGIGNSTPNEQEEAAFNTIASKGWTVYVNGEASSNKWNPTSLTPLDGEEQQTPIPFYAKPVTADEEHAQYVDEQGNFFNILGGQFIYGDDISTYGMFVSEEDAAANMRLTPYVKPQTEIENQ